MKKKYSSKIFKTSEDMDAYLEKTDLGKTFKEKGVLKKPPLKKINLDLPQGMIEEIDKVAVKMGVSRQPLLKMWIHQMLKQEGL
jgi:hypothetical protein